MNQKDYYKNLDNIEIKIIDISFIKKKNKINFKKENTKNIYKLETSRAIILFRIGPGYSY